MSYLSKKKNVILEQETVRSPLWRNGHLQAQSFGLSQTITIRFNCFASWDQADGLFKLCRLLRISCKHLAPKLIFGTVVPPRPKKKHSSWFPNKDTFLFWDTWKQQPFLVSICWRHVDRSTAFCQHCHGDGRRGGPSTDRHQPRLRQRAKESHRASGPWTSEGTSGQRSSDRGVDRVVWGW